MPVREQPVASYSRILAKTWSRDCFVRFIHTKVIKRLEATNFRVRDSTKNLKRKLLLPISGGISSITLLHVIDGHLQGQMSRTGRPAFEIEVLFITDGVQSDEDARKFLALARDRYPRHEYSITPLSMTESEGTHEDDAKPNPEDASDLLETLKSLTSRSDIASVALTHAIVRYAEASGCEGVLWGDTTTRLAEKILASTALGRGATLPWLVNDGVSPFTVPGSSETILFLYPMKDVLRKELKTYSTVISLPTIHVSERSTGAVVSSKNATIDNLMKEYFESVEKDYPSIVTNVVRTSSKLIASRETSTNTDGKELCCQLCGVPVPHGTFGIHGWGGSQDAEAGTSTDAPIPTDPVAATTRRYCYGCARSTLPV